MVGLKELALEQKSKLVLMAVFAVLSGVTIIGQSYLIVTIVDRIFLKGATFSEVVPLLIGLLCTSFSKPFSLSEWKNRSKNGFQGKRRS